ncbi:MAG TPA: zinc-dependent metalloprotease, partial [Actinomycetes bacterium]|nr:zinc-dependent metalloprotease [Actinomycetes bacterium]
MTEGPGGSGDFFGRIPLFREFARLMATASGPVNWELARQVAVATAAGAEDLGMLPQLPQPAAAPDPGEARSWDDRLRLAELWIDPVTSLPGPGVALAARPVNRPDWAEAVLGGFAPLVEPGARRVAEALGSGAGMGPPGVGSGRRLRQLGHHPQVLGPGRGGHRHLPGQLPVDRPGGGRHQPGELPEQRDATEEVAGAAQPFAHGPHATRAVAPSRLETASSG